jgi:hypothetical protein
MSSTRQAVILGPNLTGCGYRLAFTPAHHVLFETGIGPWGAMIFFSRMKPVSGRENFAVGDVGAAMAVLAIDKFIVFSFATSKAVPEKIYRAHASACPLRGQELPQFLWSLAISFSFSLDQKLFVHAVRKDPIQLSTMMDMTAGRCRLLSTSPCDLHSSRRFFARLWIARAALED